MSIGRFNELVTQLKAQYLPNGNIELLEDSEFREHPILFELPFLDTITEIRLEKDVENYVLSRLSESLFLLVSANKSQCNIGILLNSAKYISREIRDSAITLA